MNRILAAAIMSLLPIGEVGLSAGQMTAKDDVHQLVQMREAMFRDWLALWERNVLASEPMRYCASEMGEGIGWGMLPFLRGFYFGYLATENPKWVDMLVSCTDELIKRAVREPDGYLGWPTVGAAGTDIDGLDGFYADSMLGEAMVLAPVVLMAGEVRKTRMLREKYGGRSQDYIELSERLFKKWDTRGAWRETDGGGVVTVELPFGIDRKTGKWDGFATRNAPGNGFSHQNNKANLIACWLLAMFDVTQKPIYGDRAEKWFRVMKSRMKLRENGTYEIWNYWEPAGLWDYRPNGMPKHWIGVHPKAGYYDIDVEAIVAAHQHGLIFSKDDISHLIATALADKRYWTALVPYDVTIQKQFEETLDPSSWDGLHRVPWYLYLHSKNNLLRGPE
jgi:hypothetical protein